MSVETHLLPDKVAFGAVNWFTVSRDVGPRDGLGTARPEVALSFSSGDLIEQEASLAHDDPSHDAVKPGTVYAGKSPTQIAFGWDRITALLARTDSIREVIAFPKSGGGVDPLTAAPAPITAEQRKEAGVDAVTTEKLLEDTGSA